MPEEEMKTCLKCTSPYAYAMGNEIYVCPECSYEWDISKTNTIDKQDVKDANGNILQNGDSVVIIKGLAVKGAPKPLKVGTKVKNIRIVEGDHNIDCKIPGFGSIAIKSEFVKKA